MKQQKLFKDKNIYTLNSEKELKYYGSPLNKFAAENCRKDMVINNIDMLTLDYKNKNEIRIIESKHDKEEISKGQMIVLERLSKMGIKCYIVRGSSPYEFTEVYSFQTKKTKILTEDQLIKFLENDY